MLVTVNEVANQLKISPRAVQIKAKKQGITKIGNQYQITKEIAERWYSNESEPNRTEKEPRVIVSHPNRKQAVSFKPSFYIIATVIVLMLLSSITWNYLQRESVIQKDTTIEKMTIQFNDTIKQKIKLEMQYHDAIKDIRILENENKRIRDSIRSPKF